MEEIKNTPKDVEEWVDLADIAAEQGDMEKARQYLLYAIKANPECVRAWDYLSHLAESRDEEINALEKVLELQPENPSAAERLVHLRKFTV
jgi:tetratricopeptide (TPR) repeat protein